jgi:hypothetical protein
MPTSVVVCCHTSSKDLLEARASATSIRSPHSLVHRFMPFFRTFRPFRGSCFSLHLPFSSFALIRVIRVQMPLLPIPIHDWVTSRVHHS